MVHLPIHFVPHDDEPSRAPKTSDESRLAPRRSVLFPVSIWFLQAGCFVSGIEKVQRETFLFEDQ
jgi:hypothetical protein